MRERLWVPGVFIAAGCGLLVPKTASVVSADHGDQNVNVRERWQEAVLEYQAAYPQPEPIVLEPSTESQEFVHPDLPEFTPVEHSSWENARPVSVSVPILTYHEVNDANAFASQMSWFLQNNYAPIGVDPLIQLLKGEEMNFRKKPFVITFDDTLYSQKKNAVPFLKANKLPAIFCVMPDWPGDGVHSYMKNEDLPALVDLGFDLVSHTFNHPQSLSWLRATNKGSWEAQIVQSKNRLEKIVGGGYKVKGFCYPYGVYDPQTVELVGKVYDVAFSTMRGDMQTTQQRLLLHRSGKS